MPTSLQPAPVEHFQIRFALFPEKTGWALDLKGVDHRCVDVLPGLHIPRMMWVSGQRKTPVVRRGRELVRGSARILAWIEANWPDPPLLPTDPKRQADALAIAAEFDAYGPHTRRVLFHHLLPHTDFCAALFSHGASPGTRARYRTLFPALRPMFRIDMAVWDRPSAASATVARRALDRVVELAGSPDGYLVGDAFTVADLTAAAVLNPLVLAKEYPVPLPAPVPSAFQAWLNEVGQHPGAAWVRRVYADHRPVRSPG